MTYRAERFVVHSVKIFREIGVPQGFFAGWERRVLGLLGDMFGLLGKYSLLERVGMARK